MFKLPDWWPRGATSSAPESADSLDAFGSEHSKRPAASSQSFSRLSWDRGRLQAPLAIAILISLGVGGYFIQKWRPFQVEAASTSLTIESDPPGAEVLAGGVRQGVTPLTVSVAPGEHAFELIYQGRRKALRTTARAGAALVHHVQFDAPPALPARTKSALSVVTEPARLRVLLDGKSLGVSPLLATDLEPGAHKIQVIGAKVTLERPVDLYAGETASVIISAVMTPSGPAAGWLTVNSPVVLQIIEGRDIIGTTQSPKLLLPAGRHELLLTNEPLGISERRVVQVSAGATATVRVDVPSAPLSINALPWAEAWIDGKRVGETPIGNYKVPVGTHEIIFRHPELGERRQTVTVSLKTPARASVDMRKPQ